MGRWNRPNQGGLTHRTTVSQRAGRARARGKEEAYQEGLRAHGFKKDVLEHQSASVANQLRRTLETKDEQDLFYDIKDAKTPSDKTKAARRLNALLQEKGVDVMLGALQRAVAGMDFL